MDKKYRLVFLSCFAVSAMMLGSGLAYGEESINTFKNVASDAKEIRSQYKDRQSSRYDSQKSMREVEDTISLGNKALADNQKEEGNVKHSLEEINQKQRDNANWFVRNQKLIEQRAPLLNSMTEHADRMQYLDREIASCEKLIADRENQVKGYEREMQALMKQAGVYDQTTVQFDSATFNDQVRAVHEALDRTKYDEDRLDEADSIKNKLLEGKNGEVIVVQGNEQQLAEIDTKLQAVESNANYVNAQLNGYYKVQQDLYAIRDRVESEYDLAQEKAELHQMQADVQNDSETLKNDIKSAEEEKSRLEKYMTDEHYGRFFSVGAEFYSWDGDGGDSGHQFYAPVEYFQEYGFHEFGVSFGLVNTSTHFAEAERGLDGITDVSLYYGYRHVFDDKLTLKYTLGVDLPVGESKTGDIPLSDDLAPVTRLSEGLNVRPGIEALYWINDENLLKAGLGYTFKGNYEYSKNNPDYFVNPGDGLDGLLYWTHADEYNQWRLGMDSSFLNGKTKENDLFYREGLEMLYKAMYNRKLNDTMDLMGYFWLRQSEGNDYYYPGAEADGTSYVRYYGLEYKYAPNEKHAWYLRSNNMFSTGTYYDPISGERVNGRKKYVIGAGYEYNFNESTEIGINLNNFWMKDKSPKKDYDGNEVLVWFNASF